MTSGIPDYPTRGASTPSTSHPLPSGRPGEDGTRDAPGREQGEKFSYSNTNHALLGPMIEKLTRHSLAAEIDRRLFTPLGMIHTYLPTRPPQGIKGPARARLLPDATGKPPRRRPAQREHHARSQRSGLHHARNEPIPPRALSGQAATRVVATAGHLPAPHKPGRQHPLHLARRRRTWLPGLDLHTPDGRSQFAVSDTVSVDQHDNTLTSAISKAAETVLCPKKK